MARRRLSRRSRRYRGNNDATRSYRGQVGAFMRELLEKGEHVVLAAKRELMKGAYDTAEDARSYVPVLTGRLKDSIEVVDVAEGAAFEIRATAKNQDGIGYGQFVEYAPWGTPFLLPALEANSDRTRHNIKQAIRDAIQRGH